MDFRCQLFARGEAAVELQKLRQVHDRLAPIQIFACGHGRFIRKIDLRRRCHQTRILPEAATGVPAAAAATAGLLAVAAPAKVDDMMHDA
jgi:hypothetical protein